MQYIMTFFNSFFIGGGVCHDAWEGNSATCTEDRRHKNQEVSVMIGQRRDGP